MEHDQIVPAYGWSEQRPRDWWASVVQSVRTVLDTVTAPSAASAALPPVGKCTAPSCSTETAILTRDTVPLWNDKRTAALVAAFEARYAPADYLADSGNPATPAWPGFKLQWLRDNDPDAYDRAAIVIMPKDYVNFRMTGEVDHGPD